MRTRKKRRRRRKNNSKSKTPMKRRRPMMPRLLHNQRPSPRRRLCMLRSRSRLPRLLLHPVKRKNHRPNNHQLRSRKKKTSSSEVETVLRSQYRRRIFGHRRASASLLALLRDLCIVVLPYLFRLYSHSNSGVDLHAWLGKEKSRMEKEKFLIFLIHRRY